MSAAHDGHADHDAGQHDASHHDHFDNDPVKELPADEPRTPGWIPILGLTLFFLAGTAFLVMGRGDDEAKPKAEGAPVAAQPAPQQAAPRGPGTQVVPQAAPAQARPAPTPAGSAGALRPLTPDQAQAIQKQIEALRARGKQAPQGAQPQGAAPGAQ